MTTFIEWIDEQVEKRGWTRAKLARMAGISPSSIYMVASGTRQPGIEMCTALSRILNVSREEVYRIAGILQHRSEADENAEKARYYLDNYKYPRTKKQALAYLEFLFNEEAKEEGKNANGIGEVSTSNSQT